MDPETSQKLAALEEKVDKIFISVEKTRKYFQWTLIISVGAVIIPVIGLLFAIPSFLSVYSGEVNPTGVSSDLLQ